MRCKSNPVTRALHKILIEAQGGNGAAAGEPEPPAPIAACRVTPIARISPNAHPG
jgi:hypothetical protein